MNLYTIILIEAVLSVDIRLKGELNFQLKISGVDFDERSKALTKPLQKGNTDGNQSAKPATDKATRSNVTVPPEPNCLYQYPEQRQLDTILSDMMNALAKVFVKARELVTKELSRRHDRQDTRFRVVDKQNTSFFDGIYHRMTNKYVQFYNHTMERVDRASEDPCQHQEEIKKMWRAILDSALACLREASHRCVSEYLTEDADPDLMKKLKALLERELGKIRWAQLHLLCATHQLCFDELLE